MPVYSMTGYASWQSSAAPTPSSSSELAAASPLPFWRMGLELRSVNSRFLDIHFKLPEDLYGLESVLRERLQKELRRGKLELRATLFYQGHTTGSEICMAPSVAVLQRIAAVQEHIRTWMPDAQPLQVADILTLSTSTRRPALDMDWAQSTLNQGMDILLAAFKQSRSQEGQKLAAAMKERTAQLRALALQAEPLIPQLVQQQQTRFLQRWQQALASTAALTDTDSTNTLAASAPAQERALSEAAAFALRIDVAEEITRLHTHLDAVDSLLDQGGELGKRLDFIIQELHREANTLGSKSAAISTSAIAIDMKVLIEQMREQVQNIE